MGRWLFYVVDLLELGINEYSCRGWWEHVLTSIIRIICFIPSLYSVCGGGRLPDVKMALNNNWVCLLSLLRKSSASEKSDGPAKAHWAPYCRKHWGMASAAAAPPPPYVTSLLLAMWSEQLEKQIWVMCILQVGYSQNLHYMLTLNSPLKLFSSDNWLHFRPGKIHMQSGNRLQN